MDAEPARHCILMFDGTIERSFWTGAARAERGGVDQARSVGARRRRGSGSYAATLLAGGCATSPAAAPPDAPLTDGPPAVDAGPGEVVGADAMVHLEALQGIADRNGGNRASPGPGYEASVDYVAEVLRTAGWEVTTPTYQAGDSASVRQVVAQTGSGRSGSVVMAGAHLDSVRDGPGITDDGSGVAALLAIAEHLGATRPSHTRSASRSSAPRRTTCKARAATCRTSPGRTAPRSWPT